MFSSASANKGEWVPARDAALLLMQSYGYRETGAKSAVIGWCAAELVSARCNRAVWVGEGGPRRTEDDVYVPTEFWEKLVRAPPVTADWVSGDFSAYLVDVRAGSGLLRFFGVSFSKSSLVAQLPPALQLPPASPPSSAVSSGTMAAPTTSPARTPQADSGNGAPHLGGRPRKDFWEPLLIAVGMAIYDGFQPGRIADVERWMADWLSTNGFEAGEVAIRQRARAVFVAYEAEKDKN